MGSGLRRLNSDFVTKYISEAGTKKRNKDYFGFVEMDNFICWAIAETYDNEEEVISAELAVHTVLDLFTKKPTLSKRKLKSFVKEAHKQLKEQSAKFQLKASIMVVASNYKKLRYVHCGNCHLNIFRGESIFLKSHDQSLYQEMIDEYKIPNDGIYGIEESRNLSNFLGKQGKIKIESSKKIILYDEDILLLTTWGFWQKITTLEMLDAVEGAKDATEYLDELHDLYLSKQEKNVSNHTLATVFAQKTFQEKDNTKKIIKIALMVAIPLIITGIILFTYLYKANIKRKEILNNIAGFQNKGNVYIEDKNYERALLEYEKGINESKSLKETKGKKGEENADIKESLSSKQRVTQLIIDGDELFKNKKYTDAKLSYEKALNEAKNEIDFYDLLDEDELEGKILACSENDYVYELISLADYQTELKQPENAIENYNKALKSALKVKNAEAEKDITLKKEKIESQIKADEKSESEAKKAEEEAKKAEQEAKKVEEETKKQEELENKIKSIEKTELTADKAVTSKDYLKALDIYNDSVKSYVELDELDKAAAAEKKISELSEKIANEEKNTQAEIADGYVRSGDMHIIDANFEIAISNYKLARDIYSNLKMTSEISSVNEKIDAANISKKEFENSNKLIEIDIIEAEADELLKDENYAEAKIKYKEAQALCKGINQNERMLLMQDKIKIIDDIENDLLIEDQSKKDKQEEESSKQEKEKIIYSAKVLETFADDHAKKENIQMAINYYKQAKDTYQSVDAYDLAIAVQEKILELQSKYMIY